MQGIGKNIQSESEFDKLSRWQKVEKKYPEAVSILRTANIALNNTKDPGTMVMLKEIVREAEKIIAR